jgi:hypothetical protein
MRTTNLKIKPNKDFELTLSKTDVALLYSLLAQCRLGEIDKYSESAFGLLSAIEACESKNKIKLGDDNRVFDIMIERKSKTNKTFNGRNATFIFSNTKTAEKLKAIKKVTGSRAWDHESK